MAILIQKLTNVVNIIDDTRPAGEQIINSLGVDCVAKVQHKDPLSDTLHILDTEGKPTQIIVNDGTLKVRDFGGAPVVFAGTLDDLANKLNDVYFNNAVSGAGGGGGGDASAANQLIQISEAQKLTNANAPTHEQLTNPAAVVVSGWKKLSFVCSGAITVTIDGNSIIYPFNLGGGARAYGGEFEADNVSSNAATFTGTGSVLLTKKQA